MGTQQLHQAWNRIETWMVKQGASLPPGLPGVENADALPVALHQSYRRHDGAFPITPELTWVPLSDGRRRRALWTAHLPAATWVTIAESTSGDPHAPDWAGEIIGKSPEYRIILVNCETGAVWEHTAVREMEVCSDLGTWLSEVADGMDDGQWAYVAERQRLVHKDQVSTRSIEEERLSGAFREAVTNGLRHGDSVVLPGIGTLKISVRKAYSGVDRSTGDHVQVPARRIGTLRAGAALKLALNEGTFATPARVDTPEWMRSLANESGEDPSVVRQQWDRYASHLVAILKTDKPVDLLGLATVSTMQMPAFAGLNPKTREPRVVPARRVPKMEPYNTFEDAINEPVGST